MIKLFNPCTPDCPNRCMGCHANCSKGKLADIIHNALQEKERKEKVIMQRVLDTRKEKIWNCYKSHRESVQFF